MLGSSAIKSALKFKELQEKVVQQKKKIQPSYDEPKNLAYKKITKIPTSRKQVLSTTGSRPTKEKTGMKNGNGAVTVDINKESPPEQPGLLSTIFPPYSLWAQSQYLKKFKQWEGTPPSISISGSPEDVSGLQGDLIGGTSGGSEDLFGGALESIGGGLKIAGYAIPVMIGVMILSQVKGLFK